MASVYTGEGDGQLARQRLALLIAVNGLRLTPEGLKKKKATPAEILRSRSLKKTGNTLIPTIPLAPELAVWKAGRCAGYKVRQSYSADTFGQERAEASCRPQQKELTVAAAA